MADTAYPKQTLKSQEKTYP